MTLEATQNAAGTSESYILVDPGRAAGHGQHITVSRFDDSGTWGWVCSGRREERGRIWDWLKIREGMGGGEALHYLRAHYSTAPEDRVAPQRSEATATMTAADPTALKGAAKPAAAKSMTAEAKAEQASRWQRMKDNEARGLLADGMNGGVNAYLIGERGLDAAVVRAFAAEIATEHAKSHANPHGACFVHRDAEGSITGYERKGTKRPCAVRSYSEFSGGGGRYLTQMGNRETPAHIYVGESGVECLSVAQAQRKQGVELGDMLLCSTYGTPACTGIETLKAIAARHPDATVHLCFNNDGAGADFARSCREAILAGNPQAKIADLTPPAAFKDWNDVIRNKPRAAEPAAAAPKVSGAAIALAAERKPVAAMEVDAAPSVQGAAIAAAAGRIRAP